ncbi:MAG: hypothetical protein ACTS44_01630 [Candidatus Hodgkinia cicadicola]
MAAAETYSTERCNPFRHFRRRNNLRWRSVISTFLNPNAFKYKVISVTKVLQLRSETPSDRSTMFLAKVAAVLDPSSRLLALGTWQPPITLAST